MLKISLLRRDNPLTNIDLLRNVSKWFVWLKYYVLVTRLVLYLSHEVGYIRYCWVT